MKPKKPFRKNGPVAKKIANGEIVHDTTYAHDKAVCDRMLADGVFVRSYARQLKQIGDALVRAGTLTRQEVSRKGIWGAIRDRFEPKPTYQKQK